LLEMWKKLPLKGIEYRRFWRAICSNSIEIEIDSQGRFFIPKHLKDHANLENEVVFVGCNEYIEIWDRERWEEEKRELEKYGLKRR